MVIRWIEFRRTFEGGYGVIKGTSGRLKGLAEIVMGIRQLWIHGNRLQKHADRVVGLTRLGQDLSKVVVSRREIRFGFNGLPKERDGILCAACLLSQHPQQVHRQRMRLAREHFAVNHLRLGQPSGGVVIPGEL